MDNLTKRALSLYALRTKFRGELIDLPIPFGLDDLKNELKALETQDEIKTISLFEDVYPKELKKLKTPPPLLFYKGEISSAPGFAIVGTRKAELQAKSFTRELSEEIAAAGNVVVSGLALGIDGAAHEGALQSGKKGATMAILGGGLKNLYPKIHSKLADRIIENQGAIISAYEPNTPPLPHYFLERNHLIAGLSLGTLVVQAANRSGSISTANAALELGKEVFACPGSVYSYLYEGSNKLLKAGATVVLEAMDIFETLSLLNQPMKDKSIKAQEFSDDEKKILVSLSENGPLHLNHLVEVLRLPVSTVTSVITDLEISGHIELDAMDTVYLVKRL